jgi:exosortase/archaeosortase family protein
MNHSSKALLQALGLLLAAIGVWACDTAWLADLSDHLPLALGLFIVWYFGRPWNLLPEPASWPRLIWLAIPFYVLGWLTGTMWMMSVGWALAFQAYARRYFGQNHYKLAAVALFSFPWLVLEFPQIGYFFRYSACQLISFAFTVIGMPVVWQGTTIQILGLPIDVLPACAGWNMLQLSLLTGLTIAALELKKKSSFIVFLILLPVIGWLANVLRIFLLAVIALTISPQVASGPAHSPTALVVLMMVLALSHWICMAMAERSRKVIRKVVK